MASEFVETWSTSLSTETFHWTVEYTTAALENYRRYYPMELLDTYKEKYQHIAQ